MSTIDAQSRKLCGGFWGNQTFNMVIVNDAIWVGCRRKSDAGSWDKTAIATVRAHQRHLITKQTFDVGPIGTA